MERVVLFVGAVAAIAAVAVWLRVRESRAKRARNQRMVSSLQSAMDRGFSAKPGGRAYARFARGQTTQNDGLPHKTIVCPTGLL
jgi:uncharacterized membrane protein YccC